MGDNVEVTQADRNAAADYLELCGKITERNRDMIVNGGWDSTRHVTFFRDLRHRLAHQTPPTTQPSAAVGRLSTLFREIDALGGTGLPAEGESWSRGYSEALSDALAVLTSRGFTEDADATLHTPPPVATATVVDAELREAAAPFVKHWQKWMDDDEYLTDDDEMPTFARVTFGQVRRLRAALAATPTPPAGDR